MTAEKSIVRVDATYGLAVKVGDEMRPGDPVCNVQAPQASGVCPVHGTIESIRFDPESHEFVISIVRTRTP